MVIALFSRFVPCGVWEAVYIINGLLKNASEMKPDTIHADTRGQSFPVFCLAFQRKGLAGLDEHQVRRFTSWTRWVTLAVLAHAFLAVVRADEHARHTTPNGLIPLTCNEIQRLFTTLVVQPVRAERNAEAPGPRPPNRAGRRTERQQDSGVTG
jgi:hypothetical protein